MSEEKSELHLLDEAYIEEQKGLISDLECDVHFWKTKAEKAQAKLDAVKNGLYLPKITPEIEDLLQGSYLIENGDWTQDAVDFACILAKAIGEQE